MINMNEDEEESSRTFNAINENKSLSIYEGYMNGVYNFSVSKEEESYDEEEEIRKEIREI